jgi:hypothetical protein
MLHIRNPLPNLQILLLHRRINQSQFSDFACGGSVFCGVFDGFLTVGGLDGFYSCNLFNILLSAPALCGKWGGWRVSVKVPLSYDASIPCNLPTRVGISRHQQRNHWLCLRRSRRGLLARRESSGRDLDYVSSWSVFGGLY